MKERDAIFEQEAGGTLCIERQAVPVDVYTLKFFVGSLAARALGADCRDFGTGRLEGAAFLPDATIEGQRQVLDDDQQFAAGKGLGFAHGVHVWCQ